MPEQSIIVVEIDKLTPHPQNARVHDLPKIMRSLERFGQVKPVIVQRSTGFIVAGNGTTAAAERLGWKQVKVHVQDMDDETALAYLVADNATSDGSSYDKGKLLDVLKNALSLDGMGFDEADIESLQEELQGKTEKNRKTTPAIDIESRDTDDTGTGDAEPMREIPLRMSAAAIQEFSRLVLDLQQAWGAHTLIEVVGRAVRETHTRWQASEQVSGKQGSAAGLPELAGTDF